jgi:hypothetical protein
MALWLGTIIQVNSATGSGLLRPDPTIHGVTPDVAIEWAGRYLDAAVRDAALRGTSVVANVDLTDQLLYLGIPRQVGLPTAGVNPEPDMP